VALDGLSILILSTAVRGEILCGFNVESMV